MQAVGLKALIQALQLRCDPAALTSTAGPVSRRTVETSYDVQEAYPKSYSCKTLAEHLRFALRHEPLDLRIWHAVVNALPATTVLDWVRSEPTGAFPRRAWFLYESLTGRKLDHPDVKAGTVAPLADADRQFTLSDGAVSSRHRVRNNLLGDAAYCPLVRRTAQIKRHLDADYLSELTHFTADADPLWFRRAANYLYLSETKSSYEIEGEKPTPDREQRFVALLADAGRVDALTESGLAALQNQIVQDTRFYATGWRTAQNYVGRTRRDYSQDVRFVCPRPSDLSALMNGWAGSARRIIGNRGIDPVVAAAIVSFGFVYLHPFEDGNGRIHRFLIHHAMAGATPKGIIVPVSAVILRRRDDYDRVLETTSSQVMGQTQYDLDAENRMTVTNETIGAYRYPDLTQHAQFLLECFGETVRKDWPEEIRFLKIFDDALVEIQSIVGLPDRKLQLLATLMLRNEGRLSNAKRGLFAELTDGEIARLEERLVPLAAELP